MPSEFDPELIQRYDVNGPRYTSYPTANLFAESFNCERYPRALDQLAADAKPKLSLYVHVPFCDTICYYCACNKIVTNNRRHAVAYLERLEREMALVAPHLPANHLVEQLHFGGGTPTYLTDEQLTSVFDQLRANFQLDVSNQRDFSIEIDPRTVTPERMRFLTTLGINRVSLGIQDFDPQVQLAVNRLQSEADTAAIMESARSQGVKSVSVDLIYGLPRQHTRGFSATIARVIGLNPDRISLYSYAHLPQRFKTQKQINADELPSAAAKLDLLQMAVETLTSAGYVHIGMDHFARPEDELVKAQGNGTLHRNFQGYTTHGHCDLVGLGVSAISSVGDVYCQNAKTLDDYYAALDANKLATDKGIELSSEDRMLRDLIGRLMCHFRLDVNNFESTWGISFFEEFAAALATLEPMIRDDLLRLTDHQLEVSPRGRYLVRNICMAFDRYLNPEAGGFSRAI